MAAATKSDVPLPDPASLAAGHATGTLSEAERRRLYRAALEDQEVFDRLVEEESWRRIFDAPGVRDELLAALATSSASAEPAVEPGLLARLRRWFDGLGRPIPLALGTAAAGLLVAFLVPRWLELGVPGPIAPPPAAPEAAAPAPAAPGPIPAAPTTPEPSVPEAATPEPAAPEPVARAPVAPPPGRPTAMPQPAGEPPAAELVPKRYVPGAARTAPAPEPSPVPPAAATRSLRPKSAAGSTRSLSYTLELNQPGGARAVPDGYAFRPGDQFRLRLGVDFTAWLYLFNRAAGDDTYAVLYPQTEREREPRPPSGSEFLLPAGVWLTLDDTPEDEQLVLVASARPWPAAGSAAQTVPAAELDAALERAEGRFQALSWRRSEIEDRVRWTVAGAGDDLILVVRLLARP